MTDSVDITTSQKNKYRDDFEMEYQQEISLLEQTVDTDYEADGAQIYFDFVGEATGREEVGVAEPTENNPPPHSRRLIRPRYFKFQEYIKPTVVAKLIANPTNAHRKAALAYHRRGLDAAIVAAARGSAIAASLASAGSTSFTETSIALPSAQKIAVATSGLTLAKVTKAVEILDTAKVPVSDRWLIIGPQQKNNVLNILQATSSDYVGPKPVLIDADLDLWTWCGFKVRVSTELAKVSTSRFCLAYHKMAIGAWIPLGPEVKLQEDPAHSFDFAHQVRMGYSATRKRDAGVVEIACLES